MTDEPESPGGSATAAPPSGGLRRGLRIAPLDPSTAPAWAALFVRAGSSCYCRYWHFEGGKNDWLARCFHEPDRNREEQLALVTAAAPGAQGLVALDGQNAVGWMKLVPRTEVPKLLRQGPYRAFAATSDARGVWSVGCFLVDPARRRQGVARALVQAAPAFVAERGGTLVEAYPRRVDGDVHDEQGWMGTVRLFASCGFVEVVGGGPYPVMRREVTAAAASAPAES